MSNFFLFFDSPTEIVQWFVDEDYGLFRLRGIGEIGKRRFIENAVVRLRTICHDGQIAAFDDKIVAIEFEAVIFGQLDYYWGQMHTYQNALVVYGNPIRSWQEPTADQISPAFKLLQPDAGIDRISNIEISVSITFHHRREISTRTGQFVEALTYNLNQGDHVLMSSNRV